MYQVLEEWINIDGCPRVNMDVKRAVYLLHDTYETQLHQLDISIIFGKSGGRVSSQWSLYTLVPVPLV